MCGIAGIVGFDDPDLVKRMCDLLAYRGPDDEGQYRGPNVVLGARRLSIIDLEGGHQPIFNEDRSVAVVCNGEIYNYRGLKTELEKAGHTFSTDCDTEVIVHLYEQYGAECVSHLSGMFAFALWDERRQLLLLGRDRLGIKPLFYCRQGDRLTFASEMKAICFWDELERRLNYRAVDELLTHFFIPGEETLLAGVKKLPPGHILIFQQGQQSIQPYWQPQINQQPSGDVQWYATHLRDVLAQSVERHLMSDVPLGATLSGGVDSGAVVGLMSGMVDQPVKTFTIGLGPQDEELRYARMVADHFQTDHHEIIADMRDFMNDLPRIVWHLESPIPSSIIPTFYLAKFIRDYVKVILIGEGGDELFAGYKRLKAFSPMLSVLPDRFKRWAYQQGRHTWSDGEKRRLTSDDFRQQISNGHQAMRHFDRFFSGTPESDLNRALLFEQSYELGDFQLLRIDRLTSAFSLEARVPFLDPQVVEFANSIPAEYKLKGFQEKHILRQAVASLLPEAILARRKKGLGAPFKVWFDLGLREAALDYLSERRVNERGYFQSEYIQRLLQQAASQRGSKRIGTRLFALVLFEIWCQLFLDQNPATGSRLDFRQ
jgi:asparagine synthase (glutamine-hydrolysing)